MLEFGNKRYLGLDISESAIKLVEIKKTHEGFRLSNARLVELNIDPVFTDSEKRNQIIKDTLNQLLAEEKLDSGVVALSISGQSVFIRPLKVPKVAKNKIEQIIHYEAQLQVPFPINEVIWNYEIFEILDSPEAEVALVAVKRDIVEEKLKLLHGTGIEIDFVEVDSFALFNALDFIDNIKNKIILDIGAKITDVIIAEERKIWTRSVLIGGNDLTKAIAENLKIGYKDAEELKRKEGIIVMSEKDKTFSPQASAISDAMSPILVELLTDISKSIGYYKTQYGEAKFFKEILVTGGCSKLRNIAQFISENIDMPVTSYNLFEKIKEDVDFNLSGEMLNRMDVSVGLALRTVTPLLTKTNLLPKEMLRVKEFEKKKWYFFGSLLIAIVIFMTLTGFASWSNRRKNVVLSNASGLIEHYTSLHKDMAGVQAEVDELNRRVEFTANVIRQRKRSLATYTELVKLLPQNLWLIRLEQDKDIIRLTGRAKGTFEGIRAFKEKLVESGYFKAVSVESADVTKQEKDLAEDIRTFTMKIEMYPLSQR